MGTEVERKFLVTSGAWRPAVRCSEPMVQVYLASDPACSIRVRIAGDAAHLNIKGRTIGASRPEFEYPIPLTDATEMMHTFGGPSVEKVRHHVEYDGWEWEVDEFSGANEGLVVAEIELDQEDDAFAPPPWLGREVTGDARYYNMTLAAHPWREWRHEA